MVRLIGIAFSLLSAAAAVLHGAGFPITREVKGIGEYGAGLLENGAMYYTEDAGETWTYFRKMHSDIVGVQFATPHEGFVQGANGELLAVHIDKEYPVASRSRAIPIGPPGPAYAVIPGNLQVSLTSVEESILLSLHRLDGSLAARERFHHRQSLRMAIDGLPGGTYLIRLEYGSRTFNGKVLLP